MSIEIYHMIQLFTILAIVGFLINPKRKNILGCGLTGFSGKSQANTDKLSLLMFHNSVKRGEDNTGFYTVEEGVKKDNKKAEDFLADNEIPKTHNFIGHVRKSSVGGKFAKNSHPFEFDNLVLVHNGTLTDYWKLLTDHGHKVSDYDVDSQILAKLLDDDSKGHKGFTTLTKFKGAASILFIDKRSPDILYAYTNGERPLVYGMVGTSMYISSTKESLKLIKATDIKDFNKNILYKIKHGKIIEEITYIQEVPKSYNNYDYNNYNNYNNYNYNNTNISNIILKNNKEAADFVRRSPSVDLFNYRWVQAQFSFNGLYENRLVKVTKDKWYFVEDVMTNNHDLQFRDDNKNLSVIGKWQFNYKSLDYMGYGIAVVNIFNGENKLLFSKGETIEVTDLKGNNLDIYHPETNTMRTCSTEYIRPLDEEEILKLVDTESDLFNDYPKNEQTSLMLLSNNCDDENCDNSIGITDGDIEIEEDEKLGNWILDKIEDELEHLGDLIKSTNFDEAKTEYSRINEALNELRNFKVSKQLMTSEAAED